MSLPFAADQKLNGFWRYGTFLCKSSEAIKLVNFFASIFLLLRHLKKILEARQFKNFKFHFDISMVNTFLNDMPDSYGFRQFGILKTTLFIDERIINVYYFDNPE